MKKQTRRSLLIALAIGGIMVLGIGGVLVAQRLTTTAPVAPTVGTEAEAGAWKTSKECKVTFQIQGGAATCTPGFSYSGAVLPDDKFQSTVGGSKPVVKSGKMVLALPKKNQETTTYFSSRDVYSGEFQLAVDVNPITVGRRDTGSGGIRVYTDDNNFYQLSIVREANTTKIVSWVKKGATADSQTTVTSGDLGTAARLMIKRMEGKISMFYATGTDLSALKAVTLTNDAFADPVKMRVLATAKARNAGAVSVSFGSLALSCPAIVPTPTPTVTGAPTATPTPTVTVTPSPTPTGAPTGTPTPTPTPLLSCSESCSDDSDCRSGLSCVGEMCRNPQCSAESDCSCNVAVAPTNTPAPETPEEPEPTLAELPEAGIGLPTIGALGGGIVLMLLGILLAL